MKSARSVLSAGLLLALAALLPAVAGCGGSLVATTMPAPATTVVTVQSTTSTVPQSTSTLPPETTTTGAPPTTLAETTTSTQYDALAEISAALNASDQIATGFEIVDSEIVDDAWAGVFIETPGVDGAFVLLSHAEHTWSIVTLGSGLTGDEVLEAGAPQEIADMLEDIAPAPTLSEAAIAYARELEGTDHEGQDLYVIIGASAKTEEDAQAALDRAIPLFGDMQSYFIVQVSDNFEGLDPGWFVVIEAYLEYPSDENLQFGRRGFPDAYVKAVTMRAADPLPVYEDLEGM